MHQRMSAARCCCPPVLLPLPPFGTFYRPGAYPYALLPDTRDHRRKTSEAYEYNGVCQLSPTLPPASVGGVTNVRRALGYADGNTYGLQFEMSGPTTIGPLPGEPGTNANIPHSDPAPFPELKTTSAGEFQTKPITILTATGQLELSLLKLGQGANFCGSPEKYTTTITFDFLASSTGLNDPNNPLDTSLYAYPQTDTIAPSITALIQEVRTSPEYLGNPRAVPIWELRPVGAWSTFNSAEGLGTVFHERFDPADAAAGNNQFNSMLPAQWNLRE